jgi:hypothetical protein
MAEEVKVEGKKKGILGKIKDGLDDKEEQFAILSTFVRLGILVWSGLILTLAYVDLPPALGVPEQDLDPTFIASVFTGVAASFGIQTAKKGEGKTNGGGGITKEDMERLIAAASEVAPKQVIEVRHGALNITTDDNNA